jgi:uncharacterized MAPEG superfamily protein
MSAILLALYAGVPTERINLVGLIYSCARVAFAVSYIYTEELGLSYIRSVLWWIGTGSCLHLLWQAGQLLNEKAGF